jgi:AcrR family transcriptional regulator
MSIRIPMSMSSTMAKVERLTREQRRKLTRDKLLDAAQQLFAARGLAASLDEVAAGAGLTKGAVYSNFANKEELLIALIRRHTSEPAPQDTHVFMFGAGFPTATREPANRDFAALTLEYGAEAIRNPRLREAFGEALAAAREQLSNHVEGQGELSAKDVATLIVAIDIGLGVQHLVAPDDVPGELYGHALKLLLGDRLK